MFLRSFQLQGNILEIELCLFHKSLNLLVGENNSGKSLLLYLLYNCLKQLHLKKEKHFTISINNHYLKNGDIEFSDHFYDIFLDYKITFEFKEEVRDLSSFNFNNFKFQYLDFNNLLISFDLKNICSPPVLEGYKKDCRKYFDFFDSIYRDNEVKFFKSNDFDNNAEFLYFCINQLHNTTSNKMYKICKFVLLMNYYRFEYSLRENKYLLLLIDNFAEGLDRNTSYQLITFLKYKLLSNIQMIISVTDSIVLNEIPILYWNILELQKNKEKNFTKINSYNYMFHKKTFDEFGETGLSNYEFFYSKFYKYI